MGRLVYGPQERVIEMADRTLAHVKLVVVSKLRRDEAFLVAWTTPMSQGSGRESVWLHPAIPLQFQFSGNRPCAINRLWIEQMTESANRGELRLTEEPQDVTTGSLQAVVDAAAP